MKEKNNISHSQISGYVQGNLSDATMTELKEKAKKDAYEKALAVYSQAVKAFRKNDCQKVKEYFKSLQDKHPVERELVDRAKIYLAICENRQKKDTIPLP